MRLYSSLLLPRPLALGGTIGLVSPAGPSPAGQVDRAVDVLSSRGYRVVVGEHARENATEMGYPYLAGSDAGRAADLNRFFADPIIDLILSVRGGYGCARLLDKLDYAALRNDPKPIVGYSDITALSLGIAARAGIVSYSGIMATAGDGFSENSLDPFSEASFWQAVGAGGFQSVYSSPMDSSPWIIHRAVNDRDTISGPLYPVCLSLLTSLVGTPYVPDLSGAILVIEDVHEELYAVDRMLVQLRLAGLFDHLQAVLIGSFNGSTDEENERLKTGVPQLVLENTRPETWIASGVAYGHIPRRFTLPMGAITETNLKNGSFRFDSTR